MSKRFATNLDEQNQLEFPDIRTINIIDDAMSDFGGGGDTSLYMRSMAADHSFEQSFTLHSNLEYMTLLIKINLNKYQQERNCVDHL